MKILIDTHIFLWAVAEPQKLKQQQRFELENLANQIFVSSITVAEIMIKTSIGKLKFHYDPIQLIKDSGFQSLDYTAADANHLKDLEFYHRDPFDRMLIGQAMENKLKVMTNDSIFGRYPCQLLVKK